MSATWVDVELTGGPLAGHTTSMLTQPDGVTPRAFTIVVPPTGVRSDLAKVEPQRPDLRYRFEGIRLQCRAGRLQKLVYVYEEVA